MHAESYKAWRLDFQNNRELHSKVKSLQTITEDLNNRVKKLLQTSTPKTDEQARRKLKLLEFYNSYLNEFRASLDALEVIHSSMAQAIALVESDKKLGPFIAYTLSSTCNHTPGFSRKRSDTKLAIDVANGYGKEVGVPLEDISLVERGVSSEADVNTHLVKTCAVAVQSTTWD